MPLYEYLCSACEEIFELMQPVKARPPKKCPQCGAAGTVSKRVAAPAFQFRGSGWYVTDYTRKGEKTAETKSSEGAGTTKDASETKPKTEGTKGEKAEKPSKTD